MRNLLLTLAFILFQIISFSQINFEEGYFINNSNQKTICLIKNLDWKNNPTEFIYKLSEDAVSQKGTIKTVKEFGIFDNVKYKRFATEIDRSSDNLRNASGNKNSISKKETLFLKELVEGTGTLYSFEGNNFKRFFFNTNNSELQQLIYNVYISPKTGELAKNSHYKQQLANTLKCQNLDFKRFKNIKYQQQDLMDLFLDFNGCSSGTFPTPPKTKTNKKNLHLSIRPGLSKSKLSFENNSVYYDDFYVNFDEKINFTIGMELEFVLPFNKNKWAIILEPTYNYYKAETYDFERPINVDYTSLDIPIGIRHYFFLNEKDSKIFINSSLALGMGINSQIVLGFSETYSVPRELEAEELRQGLSFGLGYKYKNYSLEFNYNTTSDILSNYFNWFSYYDKSSIILGYTIF